MKKLTPLPLSLLIMSAGPVLAGTFDVTPIAPDLGVDAITQRVAREHVDRDLFGNPYASVLVGNVDVYDVFPYFEARYFQVVSDPTWNRLLLGEAGRSLKAFDGAGTEVGSLAEPHGMAVDARGRVYVADTANNRVVILATSSEFDELTLVPVGAIDGLSRPFDVAVSDAGTPYDASDDRLYVADTGLNRVVSFALDGDGARELGSIGDLGSGVGRFAGPTAIAVGRHDGVGTSRVYVADSHNHRVVRLVDTGTGFAWDTEVDHGLDVITSIDSDHWGNIYVAAPNAGVVNKFSSDLEQVAELRQGMMRPRSFHVPFVNVHDHRNGTVKWAGQPNAILVEEWSNDHGIRLWNLGVELRDLVPDVSDGIGASFLLTDRADVTVELLDTMTGRTVARRQVSGVSAGSAAIRLDADDFTGPLGEGEHLLRLTAYSDYDNAGSHVVETSVNASEAGVAIVPQQPMLMGNYPNPVRSSTRIGFLVPDGGADRARVEVFDLHGRLVQAFEQDNVAQGYQEFVWDGTDVGSRPVAAGVYFYRLEVAGQTFNHRMVLIR